MQLHLSNSTPRNLFTCPEGMGVVGIREEIVSVDLPLQVGLVQGIHIARWGGVEQHNVGGLLA